jgi:hypothetical protein
MTQDAFPLRESVGYSEAITAVWDRKIYDMGVTPTRGDISTYAIKHGNATHRMPTKTSVELTLHEKWALPHREEILKSFAFSTLSDDHFNKSKMLHISPDLFILMQVQFGDGKWFEPGYGTVDSKKLVQLGQRYIWDHLHDEPVTPWSLSTTFMSLGTPIIKDLMKRDRDAVGPLAYFTARWDSILDVWTDDFLGYFDDITDEELAVFGDAWFILGVIHEELDISLTVPFAEWLKSFQEAGLDFDTCIPFLMRGITDFYVISQMLEHDIDFTLMGSVA